MERSAPMIRDERMGWKGRQIVWRSLTLLPRTCLVWWINSVRSWSIEIDSMGPQTLLGGNLTHIMRQEWHRHFWGDFHKFLDGSFSLYSFKVKLPLLYFSLTIRNTLWKPAYFMRRLICQGIIAVINSNNNKNSEVNLGTANTFLLKIKATLA